jgi:hypothetical protein
LVGIAMSVTTITLAGATNRIGFETNATHVLLTASIFNHYHRDAVTCGWKKINSTHTCV